MENPTNLKSKAWKYGLKTWKYDNIFFPCLPLFSFYGTLSFCSREIHVLHCSVFFDVDLIITTHSPLVSGGKLLHLEHKYIDLLLLDLKTQTAFLKITYVLHLPF